MISKCKLTDYDSPDSVCFVLSGLDKYSPIIKLIMSKLLLLLATAALALEIVEPGPPKLTSSTFDDLVVNPETRF